MDKYHPGYFGKVRLLDWWPGARKGTACSETRCGEGMGVQAAE